MPMMYKDSPIPESRVPRASSPVFQHLLEIYASETNKLISVWRQFSVEEISFQPHGRSSTVREIMGHQLLSERRFFGEFLGVPEPAPEQILPAIQAPEAYALRACELALPRLGFLAACGEKWWLDKVRFFDVERERIWIFWRRILHTAHHRTQLTVYLRLLNKSVPPTYGPTADATWVGADPTHTTDAAQRA